MAKIKYNERGIARGVDLGFSPMDALKKGLNPTKSTPDAVRGVAEAVSKVEVKSKPRKNGVYQGVSVGIKKAASRKSPSKKDSPTPNADYYRAEAKAAPKRKALQKAAERRSSTESRMKSRGQRIQSGDFKGKYWGPDKFKGNQQKIDAWKKAGKPRNADGTPKG